MPLSPELTSLQNNPLTFMRNNWVLPGSGYTMYANGPSPYLALATVFQGSVPTCDSLLTLTNNRDKVAFGKLVSQGATKLNLEFLSHRQLPPAHRGDYLPLWFLPWYSDHVTKMKILQRGMLPPGVDDPDIFFTSALSGCSVFIEGPANAPTVYHGGFSNTRNFAVNPRVQNPATGLESDSITHWRLLFQQLSPGAVNFGEANKGQYFSGGGSYGTYTDDMKAYKRFLLDSHKDEMRIEDMKSEGMVFGIRDGGGSWSFYLQESITLDIYTLRKKKKIFGKDKLVDGQKLSFTRPMTVRQIYPTGVNAVTWNTTRVL